MSEWKSGTFERERISTVFRAFAPARATDRLEDVDLHALHEQGKRLILLDVDNTLVEWKQENFSPVVIEWLETAKQTGFHICIISNTRRVQRLARISETLGIPTVRGRFKPSRVMYRLALIKFSCKADQAVMIGDQMMTDILGANRAGIDAIWVRKMAPKEFGPTKINRMIEGILTSFIYKALVVPENSGAGSIGGEVGSRVKLTQQIIRFCLVGGSSFVIDAGVTLLLMKLFGEAVGAWLVATVPWATHWATRPDRAAAPVLGEIGSLFAMYNNYIWNRSWTFEAKGASRKSTQMSRFFVVSRIGSGFNNLIYAYLYRLRTGGLWGFLCKVIAALIVGVWSFVAQRQYAFKAKKA
jgi:HAD superfamily phosphatase (TIGR01668 family)